MVAAQAKRRSEKKNVKCSNCKRNGHKMEDCFMKGGGKEGQAPGKANAASIDDTDNDDISLAVTYCPTEPLEALAVHPTNQSAIIDCGATRHFTPNRSDLVNFISIEPKPIKAANGHILKATGKGDLKVILPEFAFTLISVGTLDKKGFQINFDDGICTIRTPKPNRRTIGVIPQANGLYRVSLAQNGSSGPEEALVASGKMCRMIKDGSITGIELDNTPKDEICPDCVEAKASSRPFPKLSTSHRATKYGDKVVSDLWGPAEKKSNGYTSLPRNPTHSRPTKSRGRIYGRSVQSTSRESRDRSSLNRA